MLNFFQRIFGPKEGFFLSTTEQKVNNLLRTLDQDLMTLSSLQHSLSYDVRYAKESNAIIKRITTDDLAVLAAITELQQRGQGIPDISMQIVGLLQELKNIIERIDSNDLTGNSAQAKRAQAFIKQVDTLWQQELTAIQRSMTFGHVQERLPGLLAPLEQYFLDAAIHAEQQNMSCSDHITTITGDIQKLYGGLRYRKNRDALLAGIDVQRIIHELRTAHDNIGTIRISSMYDNLVRPTWVYVLFGWQPSDINNSRVQSSAKAYIQLDPFTFRADALISALERVSYTHFRGSIKFPYYQGKGVDVFLNLTDHLVIHGEQQDDVIRVGQMLVRELQAKGVLVEQLGEGIVNIARDVTFKEPLLSFEMPRERQPFMRAVAMVACDCIRAETARQGITSYLLYRALLQELFVRDGLFVQQAHKHHLLVE